MQADREIYVVLLLTMSPVVVATMIARDGFGGGATLSLLFLIVGLVGSLRQLRAASRFPEARARTRRKR